MLDAGRSVSVTRAELCVQRLAPKFYSLPAIIDRSAS